MSTQIKLLYNNPATRSHALAMENAIKPCVPNGKEFANFLTNKAVEKFGSIYTEQVLARYITQDEGLLKELDKVRLLANYKLPVLIQGETGTGKEAIAQALHGLRFLKFCIHKEQKIATPLGRFVPVNCTALPSELIESELFGHRKGSFTGAHVDRQGKFAIADEGTLFLDEIGDMDLVMQAKLLRVLQDGYYTPIGDDTSHYTTARVVCATNKDIKKMVSEGTFREDLYWRIAQFRINIPPLKDRQGDIIPIIQHLAINNEIRKLPDEEINKVIEHVGSLTTLSGNVRELQSIINQMAVFREL